MSEAQLSAVEKELSELTLAYQLRFAGKSRVTRRLDVLRNLLEGITNAVGKLEALPAGQKRDALLTTAKSDRDLWTTEIDTITQAKAMSPVAEALGHLAAEANVVFARYRRHFAGQPRPTRDLGLLAEMHEDLVRIEKQLTTLAPKAGPVDVAEDLATIRSNRDLYDSERKAVLQARAEVSPSDLTNILAELANSQFKLYFDHFAQKPRATRRPQLLARIIGNLESHYAEMRSLMSKNIEVELNRKNAEIVNRTLEMYRTELAEIRSVRKSTKVKDLMAYLGGATNDVMNEYQANFAGKERRGRDLELLSLLCDQLFEITRQMADLDRAEHDDVNENNLAITADNLQMLEREYDAIREANSTP